MSNKDIITGSHIPESAKKEDLFSPRRRFWEECFKLAFDLDGIESPAEAAKIADECLAERDARF